jgi:hypothetical protein
MGRIISIHEYDLKPGINVEQFEQVLRDAEARGLLQLPGLVAHHFVRGAKGVRRAAYAALWIYESREAWEHLWGTPEHPRPPQEYPDSWKVWEQELARLAVRRVRSAPQQALVAENPHDHGGDDQREEHAKPPEAIRAHHAPPPLRDCHRRGQQALSHGESGAKSSSYLDEAGCRWPSGVSLGAQGRRTRCRYAGPNNDTRLFIHLLRPRYVRAGVGGGALTGCMI